MFCRLDPEPCARLSAASVGLLMDNFRLLHRTPDMESTQPQESMSIANEVRGIVAVRDEANSLCPKWMANGAWVGRGKSLSASSTSRGRGRCKSVRSPMRSHAHTMVQH